VIGFKERWFSTITGATIEPRCANFRGVLLVRDYASAADMLAFSLANSVQHRSGDSASRNTSPRRAARWLTMMIPARSLFNSRANRQY
jgi:hypothetical protein